jgi:hypothetical protein
MSTHALSNEELARKLGVTRNRGIIVPCSGCGIGCNPVSPLDCFCVRCVAKHREAEDAAASVRVGGET